MKKLPPFWYRHFHPRGWFWPQTPIFFCLNHLYMDPIWKINRFVFESSKCVFDVYSLIVCWLSADNLDYPDNRRLSLINSEVFSWGGDQLIAVPCGGSQLLGPTNCCRRRLAGGETLVEPGALLLVVFLKSLNYAGFHR